MGSLIDESFFRLELQRYYESLSDSIPLIEGYIDPVQYEIQQIKKANNDDWDPEGGYKRLMEITNPEI